MPIERKCSLNESLLLFFIGFSVNSYDIQASFLTSMKSKASLLKKRNLVGIVDKILTSVERLDEFGKLLDYSWKLKLGMSGNVSCFATRRKAGGSQS
jgi:D-glycero-alpha-D-manno-heptose-7-phosphate kinase